MKAIIMAGGRGTRFWPLSRERRPKQFLQILGGRSLLQETVVRLQPLLSMEDIYVVSSQPYANEIVEQLPELKRDHLIIEPAARNTAACIGFAALELQRTSPDEIMVVLPSDHVIGDVKEFHEVLQTAERLARDSWLVTFGIQPTFPATGYGYLKRGELVPGDYCRQAFCVERFTEKPEQARAVQFLKHGGYFWNSGMFTWRSDVILSEIERSLPILYEGLEEIRGIYGDQHGIAEIFRSLERISIDYGVMEKAEHVAMVPCALGWSDVGSWNTLTKFLPQDGQGIASNCTVESVDAKDCMVFAEKSKLVALIGLSDLVIVDTPNALLVCPASRTEDVKKMVEQLRQAGLDHHL